jgi:hypothetical protein
MKALGSGLLSARLPEHPTLDAEAVTDEALARVEPEPTKLH